MPHPQTVVNFPDHPDQIDLGGRLREMHSPYRHEWMQDGVLHRLTVPAGFVHDSASVPGVVWSFYPPHGLDRAGPPHDLHYRRGGHMAPGEHEWWDEDLRAWRDVNRPWSRHAADAFFRKLLDQDPHGPGRIRRAAAYRAVRWFGGGSWRKPGEGKLDERD